MAAHSHTSQSPPCTGLWKLWLWEAPCFWRPLQCSNGEILEGSVWLTKLLGGRCGRWGIHCWFAGGCGCMDTGVRVCSFCLSEFNSTLSEYHKTKLLQRSRFWSQMLVSQVFRWWGKVGILGWMVIGRHPRDHVTRFAPLCCLTYSNSGWAKSMLREFFAYYL